MVLMHPSLPAHFLFVCCHCHMGCLFAIILPMESKICIFRRFKLKVFSHMIMNEAIEFSFSLTVALCILFGDINSFA